MSETKNRNDTVIPFVKRLISLSRRAEDGDADARASLARLRRGLGRRPGEVAECLPEVLPYLHEGKDYVLEREVFFLVGALFALHPEHAPRPEGAKNRRGATFGATMRKVGDHESAVKRFTALLSARRELLPDLLRQAVSLAAAAEVPVDYFGLTFDLLDWDYDGRRVQLNWARDYWPPEAAASTKATTTNGETEA